jgi:hypothetical protein
MTEQDNHGAGEFNASKGTPESPLAATAAETSAERDAVLQGRVDTVSGVLGGLATEFRKTGQSSDAGQIEQSARELAGNATDDASATAVSQELPIGLSAGSGGKDEAKWTLIAQKLGIQAEHGYQLDALIRDTKLPTLPETTGVNTPYGGQAYRQGDRLYLPTGDAGIVASVWSSEHRQAGAHQIKVGLSVSTNPDGFQPLPDSVVEQSRRIQDAREALRPDQE